MSELQAKMPAYFPISELRERAFQQRADGVVWLENKPDAVKFEGMQAGQIVITPVTASEFVTAKRMLAGVVEINTVQTRRLIRQRIRDYDKELRAHFADNQGCANGYYLGIMQSTMMEILSIVIGKFNSGDYHFYTEEEDENGDFHEVKTGTIQVSNGQLGVLLSITALKEVVGRKSKDSLLKHLKRLSGNDAPKGFLPDLLDYKRLNARKVSQLYHRTGVTLRYTYVQIWFKNWYWVFRDSVQL